MTRSMTAYARAASSEIDGLVCVVELHTINRKLLDIHMHISRDLLFLDVELRKLITQEIFRGKVTAKVHFKKSLEEAHSLPQLLELKSRWDKMAEALGYEDGQVDLNFLLAQMEQKSTDASYAEPFKDELSKTFKEAITALISMKEVEGAALEKDIAARMDRLGQLVDHVEQLSGQGPETYRENLKKKMIEILGEAATDERLLREVALLAEKADVTEEITRMRSHLKQAKALFQSKKVCIGRTLDFLTQEMLREINTICSKSPCIEITEIGVESKGELEKIREQVQNIE